MLLVAAAKICVKTVVGMTPPKPVDVHRWRRMAASVFNPFLNKGVFSEVKVGGHLLRQLCFTDRKRGALCLRRNLKSPLNFCTL